MFAEKVINKIIQEKSLRGYLQYNLNPEYFMEFQEQVKFILDHNNKYHEVPSQEAFLYRFDDFKIEKIEDGWEYLIDNLQSDYNYYQLKVTSEKINTTEDSDEAVKLLQNYTKMIEEKRIRKNKIIDIVGQAEERATEYSRRVKLKGLTGITTGFSDLDEATSGWQRGEELGIVLGRPGQGKSWIADKFLTEAWKAGEVPLLYSGEMSGFLVGTRFDTLSANISNMGIMRGYEHLEMNGKKIDENGYKEYAKKLSIMKVPFYVVTPKELNGKKLDLNMLNAYMNSLDPKPTIIGIDQLSLMSDCISKDRATKAERLENITSGLYNLSILHKVPVIADAQAGRGATNSDNETPDIEHAYGSDAIGQNATVIIAIRQTEEGLKLGIKKSRTGVSNQEFCYQWDINTGNFIKLDTSSFVQKTAKRRNRNKQEENEVNNEDKKIVEGTDIF